MSLRQSRPGAAEVLRECLARGTTGTLSVGPAGSAGVHVHLLHGELIAAEGPDDEAWLIRRLTNQGAITEKQGVACTRAVEGGQPVEDLLVGHVPDALYLSQLAERFRQNILEFLSAEEPPRYEGDAGLYWSQAQVGHDSRALLDELVALRDRVAELSAVPGRRLTLRPGGAMPQTQEQARLQDLADPSITLTDLLTFSPFEEGRTLDMVQDMIADGMLESDAPPAAARAPESPADDFSVEELFALEDPSAAVPDPAAADPAPRRTASAELDDILGPLGPGRRLVSGFDQPFDPVDTLDGAERGDWGDEVPVDYAAPVVADQPAPARVAELFDDQLLDALAEEDTDGRGAPMARETLAPAAVDSPGGDADLEPAGPILIENDDMLRATPSLHEVEEAMVGVPSLTPVPRPVPTPPDPSRAQPDVEGDTAEDLFSTPRLGDVAAPTLAELSSAAIEAAQLAETLDAAEPPAALAAPPQAEAAPEAVPVVTPVEAPAAEPASSDTSADEAFPEVAAALRRARAEEARRDEARSFAEFDDEELLVTHPPRQDLFDFVDEVDDVEMAMFADHDEQRGAGKGQFTTQRNLLDRVDLRDILGPPSPPSPPSSPAAAPEEDDDLGLLEMGDAESASLTAADKVVALTFSAPRMEADEMRRKLTVCAEVLGRMARALDEAQGPGAGQACVQLLLDGAPSVYAVLFHGVEAGPDGRFQVTQVVRNVRRRPEAEHRRLIDRGVMDLIERGLSYTVEELDDRTMDALLEDIAGYQQRLRDDA